MKGLILAGGKSQRMGVDKSHLSYYGGPQTLFMAGTIHPFVEKVFVSCQEYQKESWKTISVLVDHLQNIGPIAALDSAFREDPNSAWLIVACDMPLVDQTVIETLVKHRNPNKNATAFWHNEDDIPEPMLSIWEPSMYPIIQEAIQNKKHSLMKMLKKADVEKVYPTTEKALLNINTKEAFQTFLKSADYHANRKKNKFNK